MNAGFSNLATLKTNLLPNTSKNDVRFDKVIAALGLGVAAQFANLTQRNFERVVGDTEIFPADRCEFLLSRAPLEAVTLCEIKVTEADGWIPQDASLMRSIDLVNGVINCGTADLGPYYAQVRFTFTGGFCWEQLEPDDANYPTQFPVGANMVPDDLSNAWLLQCRHLWGRLDKLGTDLLKGGDEKKLGVPQDFAPTVEKTIGQFIRYKLV